MDRRLAEEKAKAEAKAKADAEAKAKAARSKGESCAGSGNDRNSTTRCQSRFVVIERTNSFSRCCGELCPINRISKAGFLATLNPDFQPWVSVLLSITPILVLFPLLFGIMTILNAKVSGECKIALAQIALGRLAFFNSVADGLKMLTKEDVVPRDADHILHFIAPFVLLVPVLLAFSVLPFGRNMVPLDLDGGLLFFFAVGAATELAVFMAGWASHNKYSLLGAMRGIAQMISYELPLVLSALTVVMMAGSLA